MANARMSRRRALGTGAIASFLPRDAKTNGQTRPYKAFLPAVAADSTTPATYPAGSFRLVADKLGFRMGVLGFLNDLQTLDGLGWTTKLVTDQYNLLVVGNVQGKLYAPSRDTSGIHYDFSRPDKVLQFSQTSHLDVNQVGQHLSWWRREEVAPWVATIKDKSDADAVLVDVTTTLVNHFPFPTWTINEYGPKFQRTDLMYDKWGPDYLFRVADIAKSLKPGIRIYYNDVGSEVMGDSSDRDFALMKRGQSDGLFDGMYFQGHFKGKLPGYDELLSNFDRFRGLGNGSFQVGISEFAVTTSSLSGNAEEKLRSYAEFAERCLRAVFAVGGDLFSVAAAWDGATAQLPDETAPLFNDQGNPKPARDGLVNVLNDEIRRRGLR
jgi:GH35 family endo-1,4-beta-xylanase